MENKENLTTLYRIQYIVTHYSSARYFEYTKKEKSVQEFTCSALYMLFRCSALQVFSITGVQHYRCSALQVFSTTGVQVFSMTDDQHYRRSFSITGVQHYRCPVLSCRHSKRLRLFGALLTLRICSNVLQNEMKRKQKLTRGESLNIGGLSLADKCEGYSIPKFD